MKIYLDSFAVQPERAHSADAGLAELEADCLKASDRGANGWGSTGR